jgi:hypothetical protein
MISVKPILLLRVSNNDLFFFFFLARTSNVCVANAMFAFRFVSIFFYISFSVNFCKNNNFYWDQLGSCILLVAIQCRVSINSQIIPLQITIAEYFRDMGYSVNMMAWIVAILLAWLTFVSLHDESMIGIDTVMLDAEQLAQPAAKATTKIRCRINFVLNIMILQLRYFFNILVWLCSVYLWSFYCQK